MEDEEKHPFGMEILQYNVKRVEEKHLDLHFGAVKQYYPVDVTSRVFEICQDFCGMV